MASASHAGFFTMAVIVILGLVLVGAHLERYDELLQNVRPETKSPSEPIDVTPTAVPLQLPDNPVDRFCIECGAPLPLVGNTCPNCRAVVPVTGDTRRL